MRSFYIFVARFILSVISAFVVSWFFFQNTAVIKIFGLAIIMLGLAYVLEYSRKRKKDEGHEN